MVESGARSDGEYEVEPRWKEEVVYWEGARGFVLDAGWGVDPPVVYVPSAALWDRVVPAWLRHRRAEVVPRIAQGSRHLVKEIDSGYAAGDGFRSVVR